jgi:predicted lysophospholipase L1 biosynthesis ABC-type transport system permease subunit
LADGAVFARAGFQRFFEPQNFNRYLVGRYAPGVDRAAVDRRIDALPTLDPKIGPTVAVEVDRLRQIDWFPATLAALLTVLALLAVGHALVTAVRRRRRELALLKAIGFDRRQVRATVAWQATTLATVGLVVGIPIGLIVGRLVWQLVANGLGVSTSATTPTLALLLVIPGVLALVNLIAFFPARAAARTRPAVALRSE